MTPTYNQVKQVNWLVNTKIEYRTDLDNYNKAEFWQAAEQSGDCEDYALAKRKMLLDMGVDPKLVKLATAWVETEGYHAVLIVSTTSGDFVLDNRYPDPMMKQDLPYRWHKIQVGNKWYAL